MRALAAMTGTLLSSMLSTSAVAAPAWKHPEIIAGMKVFPDTFSTTTFYHSPPALTLMTDQDGRPQVKLYSLLYSGQSWLGHSGVDIETGQFTAGFSRDPEHKQSLKQVKEALRGKLGRHVRLKPAPIVRLDASFRVPVKGADGETLNILLSGRILGEKGVARTASIADSLLLTAHLEGSSLVVLRNLFLEANASATLDYSYVAANHGDEGEVIVVANSVPISVDLRRWPELSVIRDMAQLAREGYPILNVVCDDFRNDKPAIEEKAVDIQAVSVSGRRVAKTIVFTADPDAPTLVPVDFSYAIKVDQPYTYRVRSIDLDGEETISPWVSVSDWVGLLDVTDRDHEPIPRRRPDASDVGSSFPKRASND